MNSPETSLITVKEAAARLGCHPQKVRALVRDYAAFRAAKVNVPWVRGYRLRVDLFEKAVAEAIGIETEDPDESAATTLPRRRGVDSILPERRRA